MRGGGLCPASEDLGSGLRFEVCVSDLDLRFSGLRIGFIGPRASESFVTRDSSLKGSHGERGTGSWLGLYFRHLY